MSLADVISTVTGIISGLIPTSEPSRTFVPVQAEDWMPLEDIAAVRSRAFRVDAIGSVLQDRYVGLTMHYPAHDLVVRICYARGDYRSPHLMASIMAEDAAAVMSALMPASAWGAAATNLYTLPPVERQDVPAADGGILGTVTNIRLRAEWERP